LLLGPDPLVRESVGLFVSVGTFIAAVTGGVTAARDRHVELLAAIAVVVFVVSVSSGGEAYSRMRLPIEPLLALLAAYALARSRVIESIITGRRTHVDEQIA
jgi:hypothetical protein